MKVLDAAAVVALSAQHWQASLALRAVDDIARLLTVTVAQSVRKNALTLPPLTRFRWHEPVLAHVGSQRRKVLRARRPRQVQDRKVFGCE